MRKPQIYVCAVCNVMVSLFHCAHPSEILKEHPFTILCLMVDASNPHPGGAFILISFWIWSGAASESDVPKKTFTLSFFF